MEYLQESEPLDMMALMPCQLDWELKRFRIFDRQWVFWSKRPDDELDYQRKIFPLMADVPVVAKKIGKEKIKSYIEKLNVSRRVCLIQLWAPVKVNESTFLSVADQPFVLYKKLDRRLCLYRRLRLDTLIPIDMYHESLLGPPGRVFRGGFPEFCPDVQSYSVAEFPQLENAIPLGIRRYWAIPVFKLREKHCLCVLEIVSIETSQQQQLRLTFEQPLDKFLPTDLLIEAALHVVRKTHSLPFAQIWIPECEFYSSKALVANRKRSYSSSTYDEFADASDYCYIQKGKAVVGRAFSSQGSCFCKDVTLFSLSEYPLLPTARKVNLTLCFTICLRSIYTKHSIYVVEYFLPANKMVDRDVETFLDTLLSTMKEQLPGFVVASGKELGQRMLVEVVKASPSDVDSFEIGQPLPSVQSLQARETTEFDSLHQQSNSQSAKKNVTAAQLVPSCSSHRLHSFNWEGPVQVDLLLQHPTEEPVTNRGTVNVDVAHDDHIEFEDSGEMMQSDSCFEQPNVETNSMGNARSNDKLEHSDISGCGRQLVEVEAINEESNFTSRATTNTQKINCQKNNPIQCIIKEYGIKRQILDQGFAMARDETDSFEIGQPLPSVQSLQDGGKTSEIDSLCQQPNLPNGDNNFVTALFFPSCSSHKLDSFNKGGPVEVDLLPQHPTEATVTNRRIDVDIAHDRIEIDKDTSEMMQLDAHFQQPNVEIDTTGNGRSNDKVEHSDTARCGRQLVEAEAINGESNIVSGPVTNIQQIDSQKDTIQRIAKDYGITREILEQHFGKTIEDAAKALKVSRSTLKRIRKEYGISRWPHYKTRKVHPHVSHGISLQDVGPYVGDQDGPNLYQEKGTDWLLYKRPTTGNPSDSVMTVKVTYRDDIIKFKLTPSSTRVELEGKVEKGFNISLAKFLIKYQDEDDEWILITSDSDLRDGMDELRLLKRTTMRLLVIPK